MKKSIKNKKRTVLAVSLVGFLMAVGGTIAYHATTGSFTNVFKTASWTVQGIETFDSPSGWTPCDETPKIVIARNTGNTPAAVRIKYSEYWRLPNSAVTDPDDHTTTELPLVDGNNNVVGIVNLDNVNDWELKSDGYYYYKKLLMPGQDSSSFMRSVTLNCNINFGGTNNTCTTVGNATTCTNPNSPYESSTFHVYVTIEFADDASTWPVTPQRMKVYDYVASLTQGLDTGANFDDSSVKGVFTLNAHASDAYPTYYYRGDITDNYVIFGDYCWLLMRTTDTGGTKMMYAGPVTNGQCISDRNDYTRSAITYEGAPRADVGDYGAMWDGRESASQWVSYMHGNYPVRSLYVNTYYTASVDGDYTYDSVYGYSFRNSTSERTASALANYKYFLPDSNNRNILGYIIYRSGSYIHYVEIKDGDTPENAEAHFFDTVKDSNVKAVVDKWYEDHLSRLTNKLEDTIFCNDLSVTGHDFETEFWDRTLNPSYSTDAYGRIFNQRIGSVDCARKKDSYTVNETTRGNGSLKYSIGLVTADEVRLANPSGWISASFKESGAWTMTPLNITSMAYSGNGDGSIAYWFSSLSSYGNRYGFYADVRPVVSLKNATYIGGGMGTYSNPFTLEW